MSRLSNPTGLVDIEKQRLSIVLDDRVDKPSYALASLDVSGLDLPEGLRVIVIARRGNSELRTDHGPLGDWNKAYVDLSSLGLDGTWRFRVLIVAPGSHKLVAVAENVRPNGLGDSDSIIGLEPADDLGQVPWELRVMEAEGRAVVRFNRQLFVSAAAAESDRHFTCLVLPEAVRQLARWHVVNPTAIADEQWQPFATWLAMLGEPLEEDSEDPIEGEARVRRIVSKFCERFRGIEMLLGTLSAEDDE